MLSRNTISWFFFMFVQHTIDVRSILRQQGPNLTDTSIDLIVAMVDNSNVVPQGRRWERSVLQFALGLWNRSPTAYVDATDSGALLLPSVRLLQYYKNSVDQRPGGCSTLLMFMCKKISITFSKVHIFVVLCICTLFFHSISHNI